MKYRISALLVAPWLAACAQSGPGMGKAADAPQAPAARDAKADERDIAAELDDWHAAAAQANEGRYFDHFAAGAVFMGTDAGERWDVPAFRAFAHPRFEKGKAWTFHVVRRAMTNHGQIAWFDENLATDFGPARGSGVVVHEGGRWKIAQYDLSLTVPNERLADVRALLAGTPRSARLKERYEAAYEQATKLAETDLPAATKLLEALVPEAKTLPDNSLEFWLHNELTWLHWAQDDLPGALAEVESMRLAIDHGTLPADKADSLRLHERWDRAYILLDIALSSPREKRPSALAEAQKARASYEELAKAKNDHDGLAALGAFFGARLGKGKEASTLAKTVDLAKDSDVQDLYVFQLAHQAAGDKQTMEIVRAKICSAQAYLMVPLILRRGAKEGWNCNR